MPASSHNSSSRYNLVQERLFDKDKPGTSNRPQNKTSKIIAFGWYGGKYSHLDWLLPLLPQCTHFCEPFAGSAALLLNRIPSPVETYNDIDGEVVNFFKVSRDRKEALLEAIGLTPFSRKEFLKAINDNTQDLSDLERARRFFIRARQVRSGLAQTASAGRWANCLLTSRAGMSGAVSRWLGSVEGLAEIAQRLLRVQVECSPAIEVIQRYDSPETLFYCDPPYPHDSRGDKRAYLYEMKDDEHRKLSDVLHNVKAKVAISGYHGTLMDKLYKDWYNIDAKEKVIHTTKSLRDSKVITCYEMKTKRVTQGDIDNALQKIVNSNDRIDNYIIITTEPIEQLTMDYAKTMYEKTGGIEVVVLDCINFLRHFLHLFHRLRSVFLNEYQDKLLKEPDSAVRQELKEAFLVLRKASETLG